MPKNAVLSGEGAGTMDIGLTQLNVSNARSCLNETLVRYNFPVKIVVLNNGGIGPGMPEIPENPMFDMKPNSLIYGARYDRMMEAFGGKGFFVEDPKKLPRRPRRGGELQGPALVNVVLSQGSARKPQEFRWHS